MTIVVVNNKQTELAAGILKKGFSIKLPKKKRLAKLTIIHSKQQQNDTWVC